MNAYTILNSQFTVFTDPASGKKFAKCSYCDSLLKYHHSTSSLTYHLRSKHSAIATIPPPKNSQDVKPTVQQLQQQQPQQQPQQPGAAYALPQPHSYGVPQHYEVAVQLVKWLATDARPLDILDDEGLKTLLSIATGTSNFVMPSKTSVIANIEHLYHKQKGMIEESLLQTDTIALTADSWIAGDDSFSSTRCHYISNDWKYCSNLLNIEHNADKSMAVNIDEHFSSLAMNWKLQTDTKLFHLVINSLSPVNNLEILKLEQTPCLAHLLLLSINNAMVTCPLDDKVSLDILAYYNSYVEENPNSLETFQQLAKLPTVCYDLLSIVFSC